jgi:hypothetical protein
MDMFILQNVLVADPAHASNRTVGIIRWSVEHGPLREQWVESDNQSLQSVLVVIDSFL